MELKFKDMDGIDEVTVTQIHVKVGDNVKKGDNVVDIEADKASDSIKAEADGKVSKILVKEGDSIKSGAVIVEFGGTINDNKSPSSTNSSPKSESVASTSKVSPVELSKQNVQSIQQTGKVLATPLARRMARDLGVDMGTIKGTGPRGRILKDDLLNAKNGGTTTSATASTTPINSISSVSATTISSQGINVTKIESFGNVEHLPLSGIRKAVANQMSLSLYTAPHVSLMINVDAENLVQLRATLKEPAEKDPDGSAKLTFMPFFVKAVAKALKEERFKLLNSTLNMANNEILVKKYYNIGMAADTEKGLVVPVIKNADQLSLFEIARQVNSLGDRARKGLLKGDEMQGGSFTITNFGSAGIEMGTPVINYPEVAILGLGMMQKKLIIADGKIVEHKFFPLSLSIDHRVIDGAPAGYFLSRLKELLENPTLILA
ncbi:dihydrolipoamide acetyltransferase family protein [Spiroplasma ixodetis]|uniref:dihydrolipoamide acetyltransferase family protein n=1 Tax=Spiroplasma ixodetis TaxID=2141 RepID=UPI002578475F|nr:dihydrolipoamide acetyltransferase family protein [Spiroplasma ixodetis]WJG70135.1 pyruvate dehydrogenase E2 component (dihydrolipoamide acetyltransferase) [Spiroplasma ixodetis Y32]